MIRIGSDSSEFKPNARPSTVANCSIGTTNSRICQSQRASSGKTRLRAPFGGLPLNAAGTGQNR